MTTINLRLLGAATALALTALAPAAVAQTVATSSLPSSSPSQENQESAVLYGRKTGDQNRQDYMLIPANSSGFGSALPIIGEDEDGRVGVWLPAVQTMRDRR